MANTQKYINHLLQNTGMTPACSEEERLASEDIAQVFRNHGFDPEIQEFNAPAPARMGTAVVGILAFAGSLLMGIGGAVGTVGTLLALAAGVLFALDRSGHSVLGSLGRTGVSQNVIAYHKAEGPLASPRNRPVVVVAHYDSPRAELLARPQYAPYRPLIARLLPISLVVPAIVAILRILPLPGAFKVILWICALALSLVALLNAVNIITNRFVLPYTSGAVDNKSSVAAMLGVMDAVAPFKGENEFPQDLPFEEYFGAQKRRAEEMAQAAAAYAQSQDVNDYGNTIQYDEPSYTDDPYGEAYAEDETAYGEEAPAEAEAPEAMDEAQVQAAAPEVEPVASAEVASSGENPADAGAAPVGEIQAEAVVAEPAPAPAPRLYRNESGNVRFGSKAISALGMLSADCVLEYEDGQEPVFPEPEPEPAPVSPAAAAPAPATPAPQVQPVAQPVAPAATVAARGVSAPAPVSYADVDDAAPQRVSYESETDFSPQPPRSDARSEISSAMTAFTSSASNFFKGAFAKGKRMVDDFEAKREAAHERAEAEAIARQQAEEAAREEAARAAEAAEAEERARAAAEAAEAPVAAADDEPTAPAEDAPEPAEQPADTVQAEPAATTTFEPLPVEGTVSFEATTSFDASAVNDGTEVISADAPVDGTVSFDATTAFEAPVEAEAPQAEPEVPAEHPAADSESQLEGTMVFPAADAAETSADTQDDSKPYSTQIFTMPAQEETSPAAAPQQPAETVDSLMAQISARMPHRDNVSRRVPDIAAPSAPATPAAPAGQSTLRGVPDPSLPSMREANPASRASLFDLPDPAASGVDPFATQQSPALSDSDVTAPSAVTETPAVAPEPIATISADAPADQPRPKKRGLGGLFGRKKKNDDSMSSWLGVDDDYDAKKSGRGIGSWDNFEDDDDGWKGGATSSEDATPEEMISAVASMNDDELLGHDIWFVATGASECDGAGMRAFLSAHRDKLRGVFFINLESVGAGQISVVTAEGEQKVLKGDRRIANLVNRVCGAFHVPCSNIELPYARTDSYVALEASRRALTIAGAEDGHIALARTEDDLPHNVDPQNIALVSEVVTEVIRRS